jgi:hypothetical protein
MHRLGAMPKLGSRDISDATERFPRRGNRTAPVRFPELSKYETPMK